MNEQPDGDLVSVTARTVVAYVSRNRLPQGEVPNLIAAVHAVFSRLADPASAVAVRPVPPLPIKKTVTPDAIISLEDGKPYKTLARHLRSRGLTPDQYREKWGLPTDYPMIAVNYAARRSAMAKATGLGATRRKAVPRAVEPDPVVAEPAARGRARQSRH